MKHSINLTLAFVFLSILLIQCNQAENEVKIKEINTTKTYELDLSKSSVKWKRHLEQGKTKTKIKLFGGTADVTIDGFKVNTNGDIDLVSGQISRWNDSISNGQIVFDFTSIRLNKGRNSKEDKLFTEKKFKSSTFEVQIIEESQSTNSLTNKLTIDSVTNEINTTAAVDYSKDSVLSIIGEFKMNTLDWPIREKENAKSVIKDEITLDVELFFNRNNIQQDTVFFEMKE